MKTRILLPLLFVILLIVGCATPREQWGVARQTLSSGERSLVSANKEKLLSDKDFVATELTVKAARAALKEADDELTANGEKPTDKFRFYLRIVNAGAKSVQAAPKTLGQ